MRFDLGRCGFESIFDGRSSGGAPGRRGGALAYALPLVLVLVGESSGRARSAGGGVGVVFRRFWVSGCGAVSWGVRPVTCRMGCGVGAILHPVGRFFSGCCGVSWGLELVGLDSGVRCVRFVSGPIRLPDAFQLGKYGNVRLPADGSPSLRSACCWTFACLCFFSRVIHRSFAEIM